MSPAFSPGPVSVDRIPPEGELVRFAATIYAIGINPVVDVPEEVSAAMREAAGVGVGQSVTVALGRDPRPRPIIVPDDLAAALGGHEGARERFDARTDAWRREVIVWMELAKRPETRAQRVRRIVDGIVGRAD